MRSSKLFYSPERFGHVTATIVLKRLMCENRESSIQYILDTVSSAKGLYIFFFYFSSLRMKEAGLIRRLKFNVHAQPICSSHVIPCLQLVAYPFILLAASYVTSLVLLGMEVLHYKYTKNRKPRWPYLN